MLDALVSEQIKQGGNSYFQLLSFKRFENFFIICMTVNQSAGDLKEGQVERDVRQRYC